MNVYKMNDFDWVAATAEKEAKEFYRKECGFDEKEIEEYFVGEVSLNETMWVSLDDLPREEWYITQTNMRNFGGETHVPKPFWWVIEQEKITKPCVIASTEY